jgi:hypothetical protein
MVSGTGTIPRGRQGVESGLDKAAPVNTGAGDPRRSPADRRRDLRPVHAGVLRAPYSSSGTSGASALRTSAASASWSSTFLLPVWKRLMPSQSSSRFVTAYWRP